MTEPMQTDTNGPGPTLAERGRRAWDDVVATMVEAMKHEYDETIESEQVEAYLRDNLGLADPYDENDEANAEFDFDDEADLLKYLFELESVKVEDVFFAVFGQQSPDDGGDEDDADGGPLIVFSDDEESDEVAIDPYYSSEEDEEPENEKEFQFVLGVARAADAELGAYLRGLPNVAPMLLRIAMMVEKIVEYKEKYRGAFPSPFFPLKIAQPADWPAFCQAMSVAKRPTQHPMIRKSTVKPAMMRTRGMKPVARSWLTQSLTTPMKPTSRKRRRTGEPKPPKPQKPTVYEFNVVIWPSPKYQSVAFRGKQLKTPSGEPGRSWPAIALDLDGLAGQLGVLAAPSASATVVSEVGNRILATAILFILAGRGDEVRAELAHAGFTAFAQAESVILEFLTLAYGIEGARLAYAQIDTVLHLANIASGVRFPGDQHRRYTFLNVYSSVRTFPEGQRHVFVEGIYERNDKGQKVRELTEYEGFQRAPLIQSLSRKIDKHIDKSGKSVGKSIYSHSAGHVKVVKLLAGDKVVTGALWRQVRKVRTNEDRRRLHSVRFGTMGPIRLYNLMANMLRGCGDRIAKKNPAQIGAELIEAFGCFFAGQRPPAGNAFRDLLPTFSGATFGALVTNILQQEGVRKADDESLTALAFALAKNTPTTLATLRTSDRGRIAAAATHLVRINFQHDGQPILHLAVRTGEAWLVRLVLDAGADVTAENTKGETALAVARVKPDKEIVAALAIAQRRQRGSQTRDIPTAWSAFATKRMLGADWLTDADIRRLLAAASLADTEVMAAVDIFAHADALAIFIRENYLGQMAGGAVRRFTIVPINFHNAHWATLVIVQNPARRSQPTVYFFDPLGSDDDKRAMVLAMLRATGVYTSVTGLIDLSANLQTDGYTCGSWLVHAATTIVTGVATGQATDAIRLAIAAFVARARTAHATNLTGRK